MEGTARGVVGGRFVDASELTAIFLILYVHIHYIISYLRPLVSGKQGDNLRRKEVKAMPGCCGTTETKKANTEQEEQKAEAKENTHAASCEVGQPCA